MLLPKNLQGLSDDQKRSITKLMAITAFVVVMIIIVMAIIRNQIIKRENTTYIRESEDPLADALIEQQRISDPIDSNTIKNVQEHFREPEIVDLLYA